MLKNILMISITTSAVLLILFLLLPFLRKRYSAKWCYILWLIVAVRLIIPFRVTFFLPEKVSTLPISSVLVQEKSVPSEKANVAVKTEGLKEPASQERTDQGFHSSDFNSSFAGENVAEKTTKTEKPYLNLILTMIWLGGASLYFGYYLWQYIVFRKRIKPYLVYEEEGIYRCSMIKSPLLIGFFKPQILIPDFDYTAEEKDLIIKHEMTHYKRRDMWYKLILVLANALHWFNPVIYLFVRYAQCDLEYSCDDIVVKNCDLAYRKNYSKMIVNHMGRNLV